MEPQKQTAFASFAGWLFVGWMLTVCGSYLYFMLRAVFR